MRNCGWSRLPVKKDRTTHSTYAPLDTLDPAGVGSPSLQGVTLTEATFRGRGKSSRDVGGHAADKKRHLKAGTRYGATRSDPRLKRQRLQNRKNSAQYKKHRRKPIGVINPRRFRNPATLIRERPSRVLGAWRAADDLVRKVSG